MINAEGTKGSTGCPSREKAPPLSGRAEPPPDGETLGGRDWRLQPGLRRVVNDASNRSFQLKLLFSI